MTHTITRSYQAVNGGRQSESLPTGYASVVLTNNSGHYCLVRLGGNDAPSTASGADRIVPPYTQAGLALNSRLIGLGFTDLAQQGAAPLSGNISTGQDGVCDAVYSQARIAADYMVQLPGGVTQTVSPPPGSVPGTFAWKHFSVLRDFPDGGNPYVVVLAGPVVVRFVRVQFGEEASIGTSFLIYRAGVLFPTVAIEVLGIGQVNGVAGVPAYIPTIEYGPASDGAEITIPAGQTLNVQTVATVANVLTYVEYRTP